MDFTIWRKLSVYLITFLAYAWSGYGADLLGNLRDAVAAAETIFGDFGGHAAKIARTVQNLRDVYSAAIDKKCEFECPRGVKPVRNKNYKPHSNGCGPLGFKISQEYLPMTEMTKCCDAHDICYDTCNSDRDQCDLQFKRCLYTYCDGYKTTGSMMVDACRSASTMLYAGTTTLGCKSWLDGQKASCYCGDDNFNKNRHKGRRDAGATGEL